MAEIVKFIARTNEGPAEVDAEAFGAWRVHPVIMVGPGVPLSPDQWTVSYANGLGIHLALAVLLDDAVSHDEACKIAATLAADPLLRGVDGGPIAEADARRVRSIVDITCFRIRCHRDVARVDGGDPGDEQEVRRKAIAEMAAACPEVE